MRKKLTIPFMMALFSFVCVGYNSTYALAGSVYVNEEVGESNEKANRATNEQANVCEVVGNVAGLQGEDYAEANVILYNGTNAYQEKLDAQGNYLFVNVIAGNIM